MKILFALIRKEFLQIVRNRFMLGLIIAMPIVQLVILINAANFELKNILLAVVDKDNSSMSTGLISKLKGSGYFIISDMTVVTGEAMDKLASDQADVVIEIPSDFEKDIYRAQLPQLSITVNAINGMKAGVASGYITSIVSEFASEHAFEIYGHTKSPTIKTTYSQWYNPLYDYKSLMLPGILAILITIISILLSALNIVREKEMGTIEQLNVTPINKLQFIVGKLFPFWVVGLIQLTLGLIISVILFELHIEGSLLLLYGVVGVYLVAILGLGFLISTISETQTQAMFVTLFFAISFILLSGLFTPIDSMPEWAQWLNVINPVAYLVNIIRLIVLKGSNLLDILDSVIAIVIFGIITNLLVVLRYRKTN